MAHRDGAAAPLVTPPTWFILSRKVSSELNLGCPQPPQPTGEEGGCPPNLPRETVGRRVGGEPQLDWLSNFFSNCALFFSISCASSFPQLPNGSGCDNRMAAAWEPRME